MTTKTTITPIAILNNAATLIEAGYVKGAYATDASDKAVSVASGNATCFCALGAIQRASIDLQARLDADERGSWNSNAYTAAFRAASDAAASRTDGNTGIIGYNDLSDTTADDVSTLLREAAETIA